METEQPNIKDLTNEQENWLAKELEEQESKFDGEKLPAMKFEEDTVSEITVDISRQWDRYDDKENGNVKKIIPVLHKGEKKVWWLSTRNPIYKQIVELGMLAHDNNADCFAVKVFRTGQMKGTRYRIVK